jgi:hypothetical protein
MVKLRLGWLHPAAVVAVDAISGSQVKYKVCTYGCAQRAEQTTKLSETDEVVVFNLTIKGQGPTCDKAPPDPYRSCWA